MLLALLGLFNCCSAAGSSATSGPVKVQLFDDGLFGISMTVFDTNGVFVVDTGAALTCLDSKYRARLGEPVESGTLVTVDAPPTGTVACRAPMVTIGGRRFQPELALSLDLSPIGMAVGRQFDGILGMNVMIHHVVSLNPDEGIFAIGDVVPSEVKADAQAVPLKKLETLNGYTLRARLNGVGPIDLRIDTGSNVAISLRESDWRRVFAGHKENTVQGLQVGGAGKIVSPQFTRIAQVSIGTNSFTNVVAQSQPNPDQMSTIGLGLLRQYEMTFDFPNEVLYLQPGKQFGIDEHLDMSGLRLIALGRRIVVHSVREQSPAFDAGVIAGDEILSINGEAADKMNLKAIREILKKNEGDEIRIEVRRGGKTAKYIFRLRKFI